MVGAVALALTAAPSAYAHAEPVSVQPGDGAVLNAPPAQIEVHFSQDVARREDLSKLELLNEQGEVVSTEPSVLDDETRRVMTLAVPADLPPGRYHIAWYTLSAEDGDAESGTLSFTIDPAATPSAGREDLQEEQDPSLTPTEEAEEPTPAPPAEDDGLSAEAVALIVGVGVFLTAQFGLVYWLRSRPRQ
jgi:methionine-rich copper-binding protein CopC